MVTLCSYSSPVEAALAKSLLDDRKILCSLADENSNRYGGAPLAMPIRLLVAEEQVEEARRVLADFSQALPDDFDPTNGERISKTSEDATEQILSELRALQHTNHWIALGVVVILVITIYLLSELPRRTASPWTDVWQAQRQYDYDKARRLAQKIATAHPTDYYAHEYLGDIYLEMGDLDHAESEYSRAYELSPPQHLKEKLDEVRNRRKHPVPARPASTP